MLSRRQPRRYRGVIRRSDLEGALWTSAYDHVALARAFDDAEEALDALIRVAEAPIACEDIRLSDIHQAFHDGMNEVMLAHRRPTDEELGRACDAYVKLFLARRPKLSITMDWRAHVMSTEKE